MSAAAYTTARSTGGEGTVCLVGGAGSVSGDEHSVLFVRNTSIPAGAAARCEQALLATCSLCSEPGSPEADPHEVTVVTLIVALASRVPPAVPGDRAQLTRLLKALGATRARDVLAVEVLWTPEHEADAYSRDDLAADYPHLAPL